MEEQEATIEKKPTAFVLTPKILAVYEKYMLVIGILGQAVFYLQGIKIFINQSAKDVSLWGFLFGLISVSSWMIYGILIKNKVLIIANVTAVIGALLVVMGILIHS